MENKNFESESMDSLTVQMMAATKGGYRTPAELYDAVTESYIQGNQHMNTYYLRQHSYEVAGDLMGEIITNIDAHNAANPGAKFDKPKKLPVTCAAKLLLASGDIRIVRTGKTIGGGKQVVIRGYNKDGTITGIWLMDVESKKQPGVLRGLVRSVMSLEASETDVDRCRTALLEMLEETGAIAEEGWNKDFIVFFNGIWNGKKREFTYFTAPDYLEKYDKYTFLSKMDTSWNPNVQQKDYFPVLDFIRSVMPEGEMGDVQYKAMLHTIQFTLRRYSGKEGHLVELVNDAQRAAGHGGKTTLMLLILGMIEHACSPAYAERSDPKDLGRNNGSKVAVVPIDKWSDPFYLANVIGAWVIQSDDAKDVALDEDAAKVIARCQELLINRKHESMLSYMPHFVAWIALNGVLKYKNKKDSTFTHQLLYAMDKTFTLENGNVDTNIKNKYIAEEETWEWLAHYIATEVPWEEDYPDEIVMAMKGNVDHMKRQNIPTYRCLDDVMEGLRMAAIVPVKCIFDLSYGWREDTGVDLVIDENRFADDVAQWVKDHPDDWEIYPVRNDRLHSTKEFEVKKFGKNSPIEKVSEIELLTCFAHPAVIQYGAPTKDGGKRQSILVKHDFSGNHVFGMFDYAALKNRKFSMMLVNKKRVMCYEELWESEKDEESTKRLYADAAKYIKEREQSEEVNYPELVKTRNEAIA